MSIYTQTRYSEINMRIRIITNSEVRYEGTLFDMDPEEKTFTLKNVSAYGTENRRNDIFIHPSSKVFDLVIFRTCEIKNLMGFKGDSISSPTLFTTSRYKTKSSDQQHSNENNTSYKIIDESKVNMKSEILKLGCKLEKGEQKMIKNQSENTNILDFKIVEAYFDNEDREDFQTILKINRSIALDKHLDRKVKRENVIDNLSPPIIKEEKIHFSKKRKNYLIIETELDEKPNTNFVKSENNKRYIDKYKANSVRKLNEETFGNIEMSIRRKNSIPNRKLDQIQNAKEDKISQ